MNFRADPETTLSGLDARGAVPLPFAVSKEDLFSNLNDSDPLLREHFRERERLNKNPFWGLLGAQRVGARARSLQRFLDHLQPETASRAVVLRFFDACDLPAVAVLETRQDRRLAP